MSSSVPHKSQVRRKIIKHSVKDSKRAVSVEAADTGRVPVPLTTQALSEESLEIFGINVEIEIYFYTYFYLLRFVKSNIPKSE